MPPPLDQVSSVCPEIGLNRRVITRIRQPHFPGAGRWSVTRRMNESAFLELAERMARSGEVPAEHQAYFNLHRTRLTATLAFFGLWSLKGQHVLEIGPFYSYTPFLFRELGNEVSVLEGTDPVVSPLLPLYRREGIACRQDNLLRLFALAENNAGGLPYAEASFDAVVCWETMEHFNFNPVVFVRELHRVLRPGGCAFITVPNQAKLDNRIQLALGRSVRTPMPDYFRFADYNCGEFLGFHWREYLLSELAALFAGCGFKVEVAAHLNSFQVQEKTSVARQLKRALGACAVALFPSMAANCALVARKP